MALRPIHLHSAYLTRNENSLRLGGERVRAGFTTRRRAVLICTPIMPAQEPGTTTKSYGSNATLPNSASAAASGIAAIIAGWPQQVWTGTTTSQPALEQLQRQTNLRAEHIGFKTYKQSYPRAPTIA
jgi:hypothetical protein